VQGRAESAHARSEHLTSPVVDHLAELTGFRDRDVLDVTLVGAFKDLLDPEAVAIYRCVGEAGSQHWITRARLSRHDRIAVADSVWSDLSALPRAEDWPAHFECLTAQKITAFPAEHRAVTLFPLSTDREVVGVLELHTGAPLSQASQRMVMSILRIYRNFQALLDYSERDSLTGLLNRKTFDESFMKIVLGGPQSPAALINQDQRQNGVGKATWLGVIDIDHFKAVNDTYGHLIGDEVLLLLARLMRLSFRFQDRLYRFGGEEFVVLIHCATAADAKVAFERLRSNVEKYAFPQVGQITVSVGFTEVFPTDSPTDAFERADRAVYFSKQNGRNQVGCYAELVDSGGLLKATEVGSAVEFF
jgi:diguanylate cyclase (GGDEF)-like protein